MPKMIFMGTNDPYWPADAVKNYIDDIPGDNHLCYTPNAAHNLGDKKKAFATLSAFFGTTVTNGKFPACSYSVTEAAGKIRLTVKPSPELLIDAMLWSADSNDQDFRDEKWSATNLELTDKAEIIVELKKPEKGFKAFFVDLTYKAPLGDDYTQSTRMFVTDGQKVLLKQ